MLMFCSVARKVLIELGAAAVLERYGRHLGVPRAASPRLAVLVIALICSVSVSVQASFEGICWWPRGRLRAWPVPEEN